MKKIKIIYDTIYICNSENIVSVATSHSVIFSLYTMIGRCLVLYVLFGATYYLVSDTRISQLNEAL